jgi:GntR family transcriptional regulator, rspAB operon transcriptional repressor
MERQESSSPDLRGPFEAAAAEPGTSVAEAAFRALRGAIVTMRLPPGARLSEQDLGNALRISRQPVREALVRLRDAQLILVKPQRGSFVARIDPEAVRAAQFVREAVETAIVRRAAEALPAGAADRIEANLQAQERALKEGDAPGFFRFDEEFHRTLAASVGCAPAWRTIEDVKGHMDRVRYLSLPDATPLARLVAQHRAIAHGILAGDPEVAVAAMQAHLREIVVSLPVLARRFPDLFAGGEG